MTPSEKAAPILTRTLSDFAEQTGQSVDLSKLREAEERFDALMEDTRAWLGRMPSAPGWSGSAPSPVSRSRPSGDHPISQGEKK